jgi:hypothetical protein
MSRMICISFEHMHITYVQCACDRMSLPFAYNSYTRLNQSPAKAIDRFMYKKTWKLLLVTETNQVISSNPWLLLILVLYICRYEWAVYFYPDGKSAEDNATYVSLFIALASEGADVRALFELTLLDQSGKGQHKVHSHFGRTLEGGPYTLKYRGSMW